MKKKWSVIVGVLIIAILFIMIIVLKGNDKTDINNENNVLSENGHMVIVTSGDKSSIKDTTMMVGDFTIENLSIQYLEGTTFIKGDILNRTDKSYPEGANFKISLYEEDLCLVSFPIISNTLDVGGKSSFDTQLTIDCSTATDIVIDYIEVN